jgi:hypothetical protein
MALAAGLKSGRSFTVLGDLIDGLEFSAGSAGEVVHMGGTLEVLEGADVELTIRFHSPDMNNNGDAVMVDHIDLIAGEVTGLKTPDTSDYKKGETNPTTRIAARFADWQVDGEGYNVISHTLKNVSADMYVRLRGTNQGLNVDNETDADGNPLMDDLMGENTADKVWTDLWFYANPIFIKVIK